MKYFAFATFCVGALSQSCQLEGTFKVLPGSPYPGQGPLILRLKGGDESLYINWQSPDESWTCTCNAGPCIEDDLRLNACSCHFQGGDRALWWTQEFFSGLRQAVIRSDQLIMIARDVLYLKKVAKTNEMTSITREDVCHINTKVNLVTAKGEGTNYPGVLPMPLSIKSNTAGLSLIGTHPESAIPFQCTCMIDSCLGPIMWVRHCGCMIPDSMPDLVWLARNMAEVNHLLPRDDGIYYMLGDNVSLEFVTQ